MKWPRSGGSNIESVCGSVDFSLKGRDKSKLFRSLTETAITAQKIELIRKWRLIDKDTKKDRYKILIYSKLKHKTFFYNISTQC